MKRFSILLSFCLAFTAMSFANTEISPNDFRIKIKPVDSKVFRLQIFNLQKETTRVSITNLSETKTYFKETVKNHNGYAKKLNLNQLSNGRYLLTVKQNSEETTKVIYVNDDEIRISGITQ